jgi:RNA polymerase sigma-70 factor (sigma-E family)
MGLRKRAGPRGHDEEFIAYYTARAAHLRNTAYLLCGDWHLAEDLMHQAFAKLYRSWQRIERNEGLDAYARRILMSAFLDERRRPWRRERVTEPGSPALERVQPGPDDPPDPVYLRTALLRIPKRQRAVLVLRFWADLSVESVAEILGCTAGTVKSQTSHGLDNLRAPLYTSRELAGIAVTPGLLP